MISKTWRKHHNIYPHSHYELPIYVHSYRLWGVMTLGFQDLFAVAKYIACNFYRVTYTTRFLAHLVLGKGCGGVCTVVRAGNASACRAAVFASLRQVQENWSELVHNSLHPHKSEGGLRAGRWNIPCENNLKPRQLTHKSPAKGTLMASVRSLWRTSCCAHAAPSCSRSRTPLLRMQID